MFDEKTADNFFGFIATKKNNVLRDIPKINIDKLSQYFVFNIVIKNIKRTADKENNILVMFKYCEI